MPDLAGLEFSDPLFLLAGLLAPLVFIEVNRRSASVAFSSLSLVAGGRRSLRERLVWLPAALLAVATLALAIALAGPRTGNAVCQVEREGIAIAVVVDRSGSMEARDFVRGDTSTSRLDVVKRIFRDFVKGGGSFGEGRPDDLIGIVAFARYADGLCPLTLDHGSAVAILDDIKTPEDPSEDGTAVGDGLALAVERLRRQQTASKVAILLTDGVSNAGDIEPREAAELAARFGIRVYTIGAGYNGFAPFPVRRADGRVSLQRIPSRSTRTRCARSRRRAAVVISTPPTRRGCARSSRRSASSSEARSPSSAISSTNITTGLSSPLRWRRRRCRGPAREQLAPEAAGVSWSPALRPSGARPRPLALGSLRR